MPITKVSTGLISSEVASTNLNIDDNTLFIDVSTNRVGVGNLVPSTALDVTGTVTADGLTVGGTGTGDADVVLKRSSDGLTVGNLTVDNANSRLVLDTAYSFLDFETESSKRGMRINNYDIQFFEDTGTTAKFFWDASAESLGIGTTSPVMPLDVMANTGANALSLRTRVGDDFSFLIFRSNDGAEDLGGLAINRTAASTSNLLFYTNNNGSATERMRIDSNGNVGIGTASPSSFNQRVNAPHLVVGSGSNNAGVTVYSGTADQGSINFADGTTTTQQYEGGLVYNHSSGYMGFHTNGGVERMRLDSSGNLLVGTTSTSSTVAGHVIYGGSNAGVTTQTYAGRPLYLNRLTTDGDIIEFAKDNTTVGSIGVSGGNNLFISGQAASHSGLTFATNEILPSATGAITDAAESLGSSSNHFKALWLKTVDGTSAINTTVFTAVNYNAARFTNNGGTECGRILVNDAGTTQYITSSDQRLKENIADADDAGSKIDAIQVRKFDWISDGSHQDYGMIAQELQVVAPEAVAGDADSEEVMGVDYSKLVPMLVKEIQSLRARVAQLES